MTFSFLKGKRDIQADLSQRQKQLESCHSAVLAHHPAQQRTASSLHSHCSRAQPIRCGDTTKFHIPAARVLQSQAAIPARSPGSPQRGETQLQIGSAGGTCRSRLSAAATSCSPPAQEDGHQLYMTSSPWQHLFCFFVL